MTRPLAVVGALALAIAGCKEGRRPVLQAQFCLTPEHGPSELKNVFLQVAELEGMDYFERGSPSDALENPTEINRDGSSKLLPHGFEIAVRNADDQLGFSASISGQPANEVMMGFTNAYGDRKLSLAFANRVIGRLRSKWDVRTVSGNVGMFPLKSCSRAVHADHRIP